MNKMKTRIAPIWLLIFFSILLFSACYYDKADIVYPPATACDTTAVKYATTLVPIFNRSCNSCHAGTAASGGGIKLDSYSSVLLQVTKGRLTGAISHQSGFSAMPQGNTKLPDCEISKIYAWVNAGAPNN
jgi:mono/diheme cytochrome c family protein